MRRSENLTIRRDLAEVGPAAIQVHEWAEAVLDQDAVEDVELALVEALTNAIRHGKAAPQDRIGIHVELAEDELVIELLDSSPPMPRCLLDEAGAESFIFDETDINSIAESGRGLSLMVVLMDEVGYRLVDGHTRLRMVRRRRD